MVILYLFSFLFYAAAARNIQGYLIGGGVSLVFLVFFTLFIYKIFKIDIVLWYRDSCHPFFGKKGMFMCWVLFWAPTFTYTAVSYSHGSWLVFLGVFERIILFLGCLELVQMKKASTGEKVSNFPGIQNCHCFSWRYTLVVWILLWQAVFQITFNYCCYIKQ